MARVLTRRLKQLIQKHCGWRQPPLQNFTKAVTPHRRGGFLFRLSAATAPSERRITQRRPEKILSDAAMTLLIFVTLYL